MDLFGSVWEWTRSFGGDSSDSKFCALADGSPDFVTFDPNGDTGISDVLSFATPLMQSVMTGIAEPIRDLPNSTNRYNFGFRCAFNSQQ